jgi:hypothetical protein
MLRAVCMNRLSLMALLALLVFPSAAAAGGTVSGAVHAVVRAVAEEGGTAVYNGTPQVRCRSIAPSRFGCSFFNLTRHLGGRVTVTYSHRRYYVGEPRYEKPREYAGPAMPCYQPSGC